MTEAGQLLMGAYEHTATLISTGHRDLPTRFLPIWEMITQGHTAIQTMIGSVGDYDMYNVIYAAGIEYDRTVKDIGIDSAFSTIVCALGIQHESAEWYRIMAHHYNKQAERIELDLELISEEY